MQESIFGANAENYGARPSVEGLLAKKLGRLEREGSDQSAGHLYAIEICVMCEECEPCISCDSAECEGCVTCDVTI